MLEPKKKQLIINIIPAVLVLASPFIAMAFLDSFVYSFMLIVSMIWIFFILFFHASWKHKLVFVIVLIPLQFSLGAMMHSGREKAYTFQYSSLLNTYARSIEDYKIKNQKYPEASNFSQLEDVMNKDHYIFYPPTIIRDIRISYYYCSTNGSNYRFEYRKSSDYPSTRHSNILNHPNQDPCQAK